MSSIVPHLFCVAVVRICQVPLRTRVLNRGLRWGLRPQARAIAWRAHGSGEHLRTPSKEIIATAGAEEPPRCAGGRDGDRQGRRPRGRHERGARDHGAERLRQVDALLRDRRPPGLPGDRGADPPRRQGHHRGRGRRARAERALPRVPVPARDSGRPRHRFPAHRDQLDPQGEGRGAGQPDPGARVPGRSLPGDGPAQGLARARLALSQRRVLRRREEARRDPADGDAEAADGGARRDRLRARHRCAQGRRGRSQRARRPEHGRARDHPLQADSQLHPGGRRSRIRGWTDRRVGRPGARR